MPGKPKRTWGALAPGPSGSFSRLELGIPCEVASQQSLTPFHQASTIIPRSLCGCRSTRLQDFRLWMLLRNDFQSESHSRAIENYPHFCRALQVVRLPGSSLGRLPDEARDRNPDQVAEEQPGDLLGLLREGAWIRPLGGAPVQLRAVVADSGHFCVYDSAGEPPDLRGDGGTGSLVRRPATRRTSTRWARRAFPIPPPPATSAVGSTVPARSAGCTTRLTKSG